MSDQDYWRQRIEADKLSGYDFPENSSIPWGRLLVIFLIVFLAAFGIGFNYLP